MRATLLVSFPYKLLHQGFDDIGRGFRLEDDGFALGECLGHERQRQRMAVGEAQDRLALIRGHAALRQILPALVGTEIAQRQHAHDGLPARIGPPAGRRRVAAGQHHQHVLRQLRQELLAQPIVQWGQQLVSVHQDHLTALPAGQRRRGGLAGAERERGAQRVQKHIRARLEVARIQEAG
jgi:hypothetical protein